MQIHHTKIKTALQMGCYLTILNGQFRCYWPKTGLSCSAHSANEALEKMREMQAAYDNIMAPEEDKIKVPTNGGEAYRQGIPAADCPYLEDDPEFDRWNDEWDEAADNEIVGKPPLKGSVVTNRYRANYSESGHPTHCGDELAVLLNTICLNKAGINMELFEEICKYNGVDLSRYKRTGKGWQGRLRMTGRNLLASKVRNCGGELKVPFGIHYKLSQEWVEQAGVKYKPRPPQALSGR